MQLWSQPCSCRPTGSCCGACRFRCLGECRTLDPAQLKAFAESGQRLQIDLGMFATFVEGRTLLGPPPDKLTSLHRTSVVCRDRCMAIKNVYLGKRLSKCF